jgi:hypothetical protein
MVAAALFGGHIWIHEEMIQIHGHGGKTQIRFIGEV